MERPEAQALWAKVQANGKALDECLGPHAFVDQTPQLKVGKRFKCNTCGGEIGAVEKHYYEQGLRHGRGPA